MVMMRSMVRLIRFIDMKVMYWFLCARIRVRILIGSCMVRVGWSGSKSSMKIVSNFLLSFRLLKGSL